MTAHDGLDGRGGCGGVVERDLREVVVEHMGFDDVVHEEATHGAEIAVDCCGGATREGPGVAAIVREGGVGVLEVGDVHFGELADC